MAHQPAQRFAVLVDPVLRELAEDAYAAGVDAANRGHARAALVAFGSAYEAILLDFLMRLPKAERDSASSAVPGSGGKPIGGSPTRWRFETMIDVAHQTGKLPHLKESLSDAVREWRNLVHPENARKHYQPQAELGPEVQVVVASLEKLLGAL